MKREFEPPYMGERKEKHYRVVITDLDKDEVLSDEVVSGLCLVGEFDDHLLEIVLNESILGIAAMLSAGSKTKPAMRVATIVDNMRNEDLQEKAVEMEDALSEIFNRSEGGLQ